MENQEQQLVSFEANRGGQYRWITVTTLLLAIGAILHLVSPSIGGVTPNWTIAMYCLAIQLTRPKLTQAFGIGLVAAAINIPTSKAAFPYGNLLSEPIGALTCAILVTLISRIPFGKLDFKPAVTGFITTVTSGLTFVTSMKFALGLPMSVYLYGMIPVVFTVALLNGAITQILFFPAQKLFALKDKES